MPRENSSQIQRWFYADSIAEFLQQSDQHIIGCLTAGSESIERSQTNAWIKQITLLKQALSDIKIDGRIYFEYVIPRVGKRIDCLLLLENSIFIIEFKVGETSFNVSALDQVWDYALDLKNFHESSHLVPIAPLLVATEAEPGQLEIVGTIHDDHLLRPVKVGRGQLGKSILDSLPLLKGQPISVEYWESGRYLPTPTIIEAARALYAGHSVATISRNDAGAINLARTSKAIDTVITQSRENKIKSICLVTGVPGAGKTLVGLDVANRHMDTHSELRSVFLSGNGPLVTVLREALARDLVIKSNSKEKRIRKSEAKSQVSSFIQNVHHFRDECLRDQNRPPVEHVALFDEAQRAWSIEQTQKFMKAKKGVSNFEQSEPEFLISCLNRHDDWAVVVCLVGSGQEINTGEAGIGEWVQAIFRSFPKWHVHLSPRLTSIDYQSSGLLAMLNNRHSTFWNEDFHLATSMRSFRAENLSEFVRLVLNVDEIGARSIFESLRSRYPIVLTRSLPRAKQWLREQARGSERYGMVVSSRAQRLKPLAIDVRVAIDPVHWFLHDKDDTRSSYYLEDAATEFQVQGLELDWAAVVWDGDLRFSQSGWKHHEFSGKSWRNVKAPERQRYLENAYRVLLTRARQGMVIVVPESDPADATRASGFYDPTYNYLKSVGLRLLDG